VRKSTEGKSDFSICKNSMTRNEAEGEAVKGPHPKDRGQMVGATELIAWRDTCSPSPRSPSASFINSCRHLQVTFVCGQRELRIANRLPIDRGDHARLLATRGLKGTKVTWPLYSPHLRSLH
jgi:hypothetical protein